MEQDRKPQVHVTELEMLEHCGEQYRRRYGDKWGHNPDGPEILRPGIALAIGTAVHKTAERNLKHKMETSATLPRIALKDWAYDAAVEQITEAALTGEDLVLGEKKVRGLAVDQAISLSLLHDDAVAQKIFPSAVEWEWVLELENFPFDLAGRIDVREDTERRIRDLKTSAQSLAPSKVRGMSQPTMYAFAVERILGFRPRVIYDVLVKTKYPRYEVVEAFRDADDIRRLLNRIEQAAEVFEKGVYTPARGFDWGCAKKYCGYASTCKFWSGR